MARIKAKQISEFQDVGSGASATTGQYLTWNSSTGKYELQNQPIGEKGEAGADGFNGAKGDKGQTGEKGQKGQTGEKGQKGQTGEKGQKGQTGEKGQKGQTGEKGQKGQTGDKGQKGETGVRGDDWSSGSGAPVATGDELEGDHYLDTENGNVYYWDGAQWVLSGSIIGATGEKGQKGQTGEKGQKGQTGEKGQKGQTGEKGQKGQTGEKGQKGQTGEKGQKGQTGTDGVDGSDGAKGQKGAAGADGATGAAGLTGATGPQGQKGDTGAAGTSASISNASNNRVVTSDGTSTGLVAESNFTYDAQGGGAFDVYAEDIDLSWGENTSHFRINTGTHIGTSNRVFGVEQADVNYAANTVVIDPTHMITDAFEGSWWPLIWDSTNGAIAYQVSSRQFKRDIQPIGIDIDLLFDKVNAVEYKFVDDDSDRVQVGFIAEEVEEWDPRFVLHDAEGKPRSLDYGRMVPALFEVIKDLRARIEILENKNN